MHTNQNFNTFRGPPIQMRIRKTSTSIKTSQNEKFNKIKIKKTNKCQKRKQNKSNSLKIKSFSVQSFRILLNSVKIQSFRILFNSVKILVVDVFINPFSIHRHEIDVAWIDLTGTFVIDLFIILIIGLRNDLMDDWCWWIIATAMLHACKNSICNLNVQTWSWGERGWAGWCIVGNGGEFDVSDNISDACTGKENDEHIYAECCNLNVQLVLVVTVAGHSLFEHVLDVEGYVHSAAAQMHTKHDHAEVLKPVHLHNQCLLWREDATRLTPLDVQYECVSSDPLSAIRHSECRSTIVIN